MLLEFSAIASQVFASPNTVSQHHQAKEQCRREHVTASTLRLNSADCHCLLPALMQATRLPWHLLEVRLLPQHGAWHAGTAGQLRQRRVQSESGAGEERGSGKLLHSCRRAGGWAGSEKNLKDGAGRAGEERGACDATHHEG